MSLEKQAEAFSEALDNLLSLIVRGGPGSGHHGHRGRPGEVGGSLPAGEGAAAPEELPYGLTPGALAMIDAHPDYERSASMLKNSMLVRYVLNKNAIEEFGETWNPQEAGYILSNGRMLDFSGKREGGSPGFRAYDHRDIGRILPDDIYEETEGYGNPSEGMIWFMNMSQAIRFSYFRDGTMVLDISRQPTYKQIALIKDYIETVEYLAVDFSDDEGRTIWSTEIDSPGRREVNQVIRQSKELLKKRSMITLTMRGGPGSGHHSHAGRPGQVGGSLPGRVAKLEREMGIQRIPAPENGKPVTLRLWRGETERTPVDEGMYGKGTYFTPHRHYAEGFAHEGRLIEADVTLKKPFVAGYWEVKDLGRDAMRAVLDEGGNAREANEAAAQEIREFLEAQGYDGIVIITDKMSPRPETVNEVIVFWPDEAIVERGGPGSGHRGHRGRPGHVGGSLPRGEGLLSPYLPGPEIVVVEPDKPKYLSQLPLIKDKPRDLTKEGIWQRGITWIRQHAGLYDPEIGWYFRSTDHDKKGDPLFAILKNGEIRVGQSGFHSHSDLIPYGEESIRGFMIWVGEEPVLLYYQTGFENIEMLYKKWDRLLDAMGYRGTTSPTLMVSDDGGWAMRFPNSNDNEGFPPPDVYRAAGSRAAYFNVILDGDLPEKQGQILGQFEGLEAVPPDRLHITLLYIEDCERNLLEAMAAGLSEPLAFNVEATGLEIMGKDKDWLTLKVNPSPGLIRLYHEVLTLASINGLPISDYSKPDEYKPHISLAQGDLSGIILPDIEPFKVGVVGVQASVDDYKTVSVRPLKERGGPGSGHHGHRGRPGKVGGSLPREAVSISLEGTDTIRLPQNFDRTEAFKLLRDVRGFSKFDFDEETGDWLIIRDLDEALKHTEDVLRPRELEWFYLYTEEGEMLRVMGTPTNVPMGQEATDNMKHINDENEWPDRVVGIHNHPPNWGGESFPPSFTDFRTMILFGHTEMHVVTPDGKWVVKAKGREISPSVRTINTMADWWNKYADDHLYDYFPHHTKDDIGTPEWDYMLRVSKRAATDYAKFATQRILALNVRFSELLEVEWIPLNDQE